MIKTAKMTAVVMAVTILTGAASAAEPAAGDLQTQIDALKQAGNMGRGMCGTVRGSIGKNLSCMGDAPVRPLAELLSSESRDTRWAAAIVLAMIGPEAEAALPALEKTFGNEKEDIGVRVRAARAIADIKGTNPQELYKAIPDVEKRIVADSKATYSSLQSDEVWQRYLAGETNGTRKLSLFHGISDSIGDEETRILHDLATGKNLKAANQWLREQIANNKGNTKLPWMFGSNSRHFPGRLEPDVEAALQELVFKQIEDAGGWAGDWGSAKSTAVVEKFLEKEDQGQFVMSWHNWLSRSDAIFYLGLQSLKDNPAFRNRKFKIPDSKNHLYPDVAQGGDTVLERYNAMNEYFRVGVKQCALYGLFNEYASPHYEQKTYCALRWLLDFATDPVVAKRMAMFMDLAMVDITQASLTAVRGGAKSRAKSGGIGSRLDPDLVWWLGEHHQYLLELPGFKGYLAPEPAILLRRLGPTEPVYEIANRLPQGDKGRLLSTSMSYIYRTPDYIIGCAMFDPTDGKKYAPLGMWSGVISRDIKGVYFDAYTGEKWNVQDKDVMVAQCFTGFGYPGDPRVDFTPGWEMVEKDGWVFVSNDEACVAVKIVTGGYTWKTPARRLMLKEKYSPIIVQTGRRADYGSFAKFQEAILKAPLKYADNKLEYTGPNSARIEFFCVMAEDTLKASGITRPDYVLPTIDGKTLDLDLKYNYKSPYMECKTGSDVVTLRYGARRWEYDFAKNTVTEIKE